AAVGTRSAPAAATPAAAPVVAAAAINDLTRTWKHPARERCRVFLFLTTKWATCPASDGRGWQSAQAGPDRQARQWAQSAEWSCWSWSLWATAQPSALHPPAAASEPEGGYRADR